MNSYTNKALAHRDDPIKGGPPPPVITWADLDDAIDTVGRIHKKYFSLCHPAETLGILPPLISPGWITSVTLTQLHTASLKVRSPVRRAYQAPPSHA